MSYVDQNNRGEKTLSGVGSALLVAGIGYALVTGLAMNISAVRQAPLMIHNYDPVAPPPPPKPTPNLPKTSDTASNVPQSPVLKTPEIEIGTIDLPPIAGPDLPAWPPVMADRGATSDDASAAASQAIAARPKGVPGEWVTSDDYPAAALRAGQQGRTGFSLDIGADGRVTGCAITRSSGSADLDQTACRLLIRRAHFMPARDTGGSPVAAHYASSVIWTMPTD